MVTAAVLAGGSGSRMGSDIPKQYLPVNGKPIIVYTLEKFIENENTDYTVVAVAQSYVDYVEKLIREYFPGYEKFSVIPGGKTRSDTLMNVLEHLNEKGISENDVILTHDAVRPFIDGRIISDNISSALKYGACNTCVPAVDTVFISRDGEFIDEVPKRSTVFHAQTPQSFRTKELYELCKKIPADVFSELTDGCSVYTYCGKKVFMVKGSENNIKITYPSDIKKAEIFISGE